MLRLADRLEHGGIELRPIGQHVEMAVEMHRAEHCGVEAVDELLRRAVEPLVQRVADVRREERHNEQPAEKDAARQGKQLAVGINPKHGRVPRRARMKLML